MYDQVLKLVGGNHNEARRILDELEKGAKTKGEKFGEVLKYPAGGYLETLRHRPAQLYKEMKRIAPDTLVGGALGDLEEALEAMKTREKSVPKIPKGTTLKDACDNVDVQCTNNPHLKDLMLNRRDDEVLPAKARMAKAKAANACIGAMTMTSTIQQVRENAAALMVNAELATADESQEEWNTFAKRLALGELERPFMPGVNVLGVGYDALSNSMKTPILYPTEKRTVRGSGTDVSLLERFSLPMSSIGKRASTLLKMGDGQFVVYETMEEWRAAVAESHGLHVGTPVRTFDTSAEIVEEAFARGYVIAEKTYSFDFAEVQLRPMDDFDARLVYDRADDLLYRGGTPNIAMRTREMDETMHSADTVSAYAWKGLDYRLRPTSFLHPAFVNAWSDLPYCCFSEKSLLIDEAFYPDQHSGFFMRNTESDLIQSNQRNHSNPRNEDFLCSDEKYTRLKSHYEDELGLTVPKPCTYKDLPAIQKMIRNFGATYVTDGMLGGSVTKSYVLDREVVELAGDSDLAENVKALINDFEEHTQVRRH